MHPTLRITIFAALLVFLAGCPGWSDAGPARVQGIWSGTLVSTTAPQAVMVQGVIREGGIAFLYDSGHHFYNFTPFTDERYGSGVMQDLTITRQDCSSPICGVDFVYASTDTAYPDPIDIN